MNMLRALLSIFSILVLSQTAFSAEVKKINEKSGAVYIDEGNSTGFTKGRKVCLFEGKKKVACGIVAKAVKTKAIIKVPKNKIPSIHTGFTVTLQAEVATPPPVKPTASPYMMAVNLNAHFMLMSPATYNNVSYIPPATDSTTHWETSSAAKSMIIPPAFGIDIEMINWGVVLGFRFGMFKSESAPSTYDTSLPSTTMTADTKATDIGITIDYIFMKPWNINIGAGLDIDMTSVTMTGTQTDESDASVSNEFYTLDSSLRTLSLHIPVIYKHAFGSFGINAGLAVFVPLYAMGPTQTVNSPTSGGVTDSRSPVADQDTDLMDAIAHKKASVGLDGILGVFYQF